ncbi:MAG: acyl-CoA reductase [Salibacteraceae bacterium]
MDIQQRILAFVQLGQHLSQALEEEENPEQNLHGVIRRAHHENGWFDEKSVRFALCQWAELLTAANLENWLSHYPELHQEREAKKVGLILAGNVPLVGLHDLLCVLLAGHTVVAKTSSKDRQLVTYIINTLLAIEPAFAPKVLLTEDRMVGIEAMIATGSNNSTGYFEYYFGKYPHIIRKNRSSVAVLDGSESEAELSALGEDIFRYYGLGCRNVSKLLVPPNYDFDPLFQAIFSWKEVLNNPKYFNNYEYNKTIYLLNNDPMIENGFVVLKEDEHWVSPVGMLFYETVSNPEAVNQHLTKQQNALQCVVGHNHLSFGVAQKPALNDYADGVDTMRFLVNLDTQ